MKNPNDPPEIEPATFRIVALCLNQLRYLLINCTIGKEISNFCATEISVTVRTWPVNSSCVTIVTCRSYLHVYLFKIHINNIASSKNIHSKCCRRFRYFGESFSLYFLPVMRATVSSHLFINTTKCVVTSPLHWFPEIFDEKWWLYFQRAEPSSKFSSFGYKTHTVSRNVTNQLTSNIISYNRRKCRLFIPL